MKQEWEIKKLGEVCDVIGGSTPKTSEDDFWDGEHYWISPAELDGSKYVYSTTRTITDAGVRSAHLQILPIGTVLLSSRAPIGKVAITKVPMYCNQGFKNLVCGKDLINEYVYWFLKHNTDYLNSLGTGATFKEISKKVVGQIPIPVPPIAEQEKIVAELDCLSGIIEKKKQQSKELDNLAQAIFYDMFGDPITNEKGWEVKTLGDMCDIINGFAFKSPLFTEDGDYILRISNIQEGYVDLKDVAYFHKSDYPKVNFEKYAVLPNDIVIALSGATTGKLGINKTGFKLYLNQRVAICREKNDKILKEYLLYYLHEQSKKFLSDAAGVAQPNLSTEQMKEYKMCVPTVAMQQEFASKIEAIEKQKELITRSIKETETLFNSRMDYYFN